MFLRSWWVEDCETCGGSLDGLAPGRAYRAKATCCCMQLSGMLLGSWLQGSAGRGTMVQRTADLHYNCAAC